MIDFLPPPLPPREIVRVRYLRSVVEDFEAPPVALGSCFHVDAPIERKHEFDTGFRASWDKFRTRTFDDCFGRRNSLLRGALGMPSEQIREDLAAIAAATEHGAVFGDTENA